MMDLAKLLEIAEISEIYQIEGNGVNAEDRWDLMEFVKLKKFAK